MQEKTIKYHYVFLLLMVLLSYAPISGFLYALKNDAFTGYFPPKMFFSDLLQQGRIPLWNPNLNFGFPIYGDMSMAWWNPVTWLIGGTAGYNVYSFTVEELCYILLASISFFTLTGRWKWHQTARINAALSYACGGYFIGHIQHFNWLSGMAFFPLVLYFYLKLIEHSSVKNYAGMSISTYLFFTSAHPGLIIGAIYFMLFLIIPDLIGHLKNGSRAIIHFSSVHILLLIVLIATLAGPLYAYIEVIPHTTRGSKIDGAISLTAPTSFQSWLSLLLPFSTVKNESFFQTDIAMRNCYMGITTLIFFTAAFRKKMWKNEAQWLSILLFFILLSAGGMFGEFANRYLPLIGYVRLSGEFTIFALIAIIMLSGSAFNQYLLAQHENFHWKKPVKWLAGIAALAVIIAVTNVLSGHSSIVFSTLSPPAGVSNFLKWVVDNITFWDTILLQGCMQLVILFWFNRIAGGKSQYLKWLIAADLVMAALLNIPFTGVGKMSPSEMQLLINGARQDKLFLSQKSDTIAIKKIIGDVKWYSKTPGNMDEISYPMILSASQKYFLSPRKKANDRMPFVIMDSGHLNNLSLSADHIKFQLSTPSPTTVTIQQINYPGWKVSGDQGPISIAGHPDQLLSFEVSPATQSIEIHFDNPVVKFFVYYSAGVLILLSLLFLFAQGKIKH